MTRPILHDYFRSSAAYRVRIALNLKGVDYDHRIVNLAEGDQKSAEYRALNPQGFVPMLEIDGHRLTQSLAICDYLDARYDPSRRSCPAIRPNAPMSSRWRWPSPATSTRSTICACSNISPASSAVEEQAKDDWYRHWVARGARRAGGDGRARAPAPSCSATRRRWPTSAWSRSSTMRAASPSRSTPYPTLRRADETASAHAAFAAAHPDRQEQSP